MAVFSRHAVLEWEGDVIDGGGVVTAGTRAFATPVTFPRIAGEAPHKTTPKELLAASHATCFGIGLRSSSANVEDGLCASPLRPRSLPKKVPAASESDRRT